MVSHNPECLLLERDETNDPPAKHIREESSPPVTGTHVTWRISATWDQSCMNSPKGGAHEETQHP